MRKVDAVILAGSPAGSEMAPAGRIKSRAMIRIGDRTMLQRVVDALRESQFVGKIAAVGDVGADGLDRVVEPGGDLVSNIKLGIEALETNEPVLTVCSDIPLLTGEAVRDFLERALPLEVDLAYPIIPKTFCEAKYPSLRRTYLKTADGVFTGGNLMLISPEFVARNWGKIQEAYHARKRITRLARMIGAGMLVRVLAAQVLPSFLSVSLLEKAASRTLNARVAAVVSAYPEIGEDVDKPADLEAVRQVLGEQA